MFDARKVTNQCIIWIRKFFEENLGFTYAELDRYIRTGIMEEQEKKKRIDLLHEKNLFKVKPMTGFTL